MTAPIFYLGTHRPTWLERVSVPLFVSRHTLRGRRSLPLARTTWALDSGGFTELSSRGAWSLSPREYVAEVARFASEIGSLAWAAPQDWMCEPAVVAKTGLSVREHQRRTVANFLELRAIAPELPFVPVLQGWGVADYWRHVEEYAAAGVDLAREPLVAVGTVCRRQDDRGVLILSTLASAGLRLHGFGVKTAGLRAAWRHLVSADSMAWSLAARRRPPTTGHDHKSCANCLEFALDWRADVLASFGEAA